MSEYELIRRQLQPGERLVWSGRPTCANRLTLNTVLGSFFGLVFLGAGAAIVVAALREGNILGVSFGLIFFIVGSAVIVSALFYDSWRRNVTLYGMTNRRAIVIDGRKRRRVRSVGLHNMKEIVLKVRESGKGTITCVSMMDEWYRKNKKGEYKQIPLFLSIVDVRHVHDLLIETKNNLYLRRH